MCQGCPRLQHLDVSFCLPLRSPEFVSDSLVVINASWCTALTDSALLGLHRCSSLSHLLLCGCSSLSAPFLNVKTLQTVDLCSCTALLDVGVQHIINNCPALEVLLLRKCDNLQDPLLLSELATGKQPPLDETNCPGHIDLRDCAQITGSYSQRQQGIVVLNV